MTDYLHRAISAYQQLKSTGIKPDEELIAGIILANLPDRFEPLIMALKNCGENIAVDNVRNRLLAEDVKPQVDDSREHAFVNEKFKGKKYFKGKCFKCNLYDHKSSDCVKPSRPNVRYNENKSSKKNGVKSKQPKREEAYMADVYVTSSNPDPNIWFTDSCASYHMTPHKELIDNYTKPSIKLIKTGSSVIEVEGVGNVTFLLSRNRKKENVTFTNVLHVPELTANLLSIKYLNKTFGMVTTFTGERCFVYKNKHLVASGTGVSDNLYSLDICNEWTLITHNSVSNDLLHKRAGHLSNGGMIRLKDMVEGFTFNGELDDCTSCIKGKMHRQPFPKGKTKRSKEILGIVHTDLCGPMNVASIGGYQYFVSFIDDLSRMIFVYF
ncbi:Retrovirus-related Pol polyprotein from transposon TNT 1-94 [Araneus ventricosus]|uniref:Retrovirus-related Pol polyprotein from transposon TNT 1-94 n=1 Tax=Araneus ventricosus TaxID=182803 RepID=A0A4Y2MQ23_ARAVE|nr:Retrovirus-related Pol polyprotein from transposon TNT 1-94 [Araneus ventricosus]